MGLVTYNGTILMAGGGLANSKDCCCGARNCYCFTRSVNMVVVARWRKCYRVGVYDSVAGVWIYPDGQPCDGTAAGMICPPGAFGRFINFTGTTVNNCGCGSSSESFNATTIGSLAQWNACTAFGSPP